MTGAIYLIIRLHVNSLVHIETSHYVDMVNYKTYY